VTDRGCPVCRIAMTSFVAAGTDVTIDLCEECRGVWLDAGELKHLEQCARPPKGLVASLKRILGM
jgi:Zn-finger nucleic acid-binding protein